MLKGVLVVIPAGCFGKLGGLHGVNGVFEEGEGRLDCGLRGSRLLLLKIESPALEG
jgi:hypothetical protein